MNILAVIPARGGSKGIPRKNVRLLNGKPLIWYSINNAKSCKFISDVVVTSDDEEILELANNYGTQIIKRCSELSEDAVTLDPVIYDAVNKAEQRNNIKYDIVITLQATSPLLTVETLNKAISYFIETKIDTCISVLNKPHLSWGEKDGSIIPNYTERLNRQLLPPNYLETGAFLITKREFVKESSRIGQKISVFNVPESESIDIDSKDDWILCENILKRKRIIFRCEGHKLLGLGHVYRCLLLAYRMTSHEIIFVLSSKSKEGVEKIRSSNMPYKVIDSDDEFFAFCSTWKPDIVVNDFLDTDKEYILKLKKTVNRVINFEDLGSGTEYADAVINALYDIESNKSNFYFGEKYFCLRDEFLTSVPKNFSSKVYNVLVLFGGTDPANSTAKLYNCAKILHKQYPEIKFNFITGPGYDCSVNNIVSLPESNIFVFSNLIHVSSMMRNCDIAFTSQGRTVFELASLGIPSVVLAANEREQLHKFAKMENGFLNLGLGKNIDAETICSTFSWLVETSMIRREMRALMQKHDLHKGTNRCINIILGDESY